MSITEIEKRYPHLQITRQSLASGMKAEHIAEVVVGQPEFLDAVNYLERGVAVHREELVFAHRNHTLVAEVAYRGGVFHVLVSAVYTYIFLMVEGGVVPVALPVVVGEYDGLGRVYRVRHRLPARRHFFAVGEISRRVDGRFRHVACTCSVGSVEHKVGVRALKGGRTHYGEIFPGVGEVPPAGRGREAYLGVEDYVRLLVGVALAGGDYDYAVGCAASVYGCRGGVFEHLYGFDVVRIDFGEGALDTVHQAERVIHSQAAGILRNVSKITDTVQMGQTIALVETKQGEVPVYATLTGLLRGLLRDGYPVSEGFKIADIDPRLDEYSNCFTISDKARCIAGGAGQRPERGRCV